MHVPATLCPAYFGARLHVSLARVPAAFVLDTDALRTEAVGGFNRDFLFQSGRWIRSLGYIANIRTAEKHVSTTCSSEASQ